GEAPPGGPAAAGGAAPHLPRRRPPGNGQAPRNPDDPRSAAQSALPTRGAVALQLKNRQRPTLPGPRGPSTIGAEGLNCSVRNGKRCFPLAKATGNRRETAAPGPSKLHSATRASQKYVKPSTH